MRPTFTLRGDPEESYLDLLCDELRSLPGWAHDERIEGLLPEALDDLLVEETARRQAIMGDPPATLCFQSFAGNVGVDRVTAAFSQQLVSDTDWSSSSLKSLGTTIFELGENVIQHSESAGGVAVLRVCPEEQRIALAIADGGIGIRRSLVRNPEFGDIGDDLTAIVKAMGAQATGEAGTGGGMGLFLARCLVRSNGGTFLVRSGEARREEGETLSDSSQLPHLQGTLISVEARTDRPFDYDDNVAERLRLRSM